MKNELQIFKYNDKPVRMVGTPDDPWWVLKDVCDVLDIARGARIAERLEEDEVRQTYITDKIGRSQETLIVNESGLYNVILRSDKPEAKPFRRWVTHEVLPSIRKTGTYSANPEQEALAEAKLNNSRARVSSMWMKIAEKISVPEYQNICASYASKALAGHEVIPLPEAVEHYFTATEIGNLLGVSGQRIGKIANEHGMKTDEYGKTVWDKSRYSAKQVETFRYNEKALQRFRELLGESA